MMVKRCFVFIALMCVVSSVCTARPNVLIIIADDCTYKELPMYGGENVTTPEIDRLAGSGMVFDNAYLSIAMCNPCRTELYTGLYPARNGACWNHSAARPGTKSIVHYLRDMGYRVGLTGKKHVGPPKVFPFEKVTGLETRCVSQTAVFDNEYMKSFMTRDTTQPFCLVVGLVVPHAPWTVGDPDRFDLKTLKLPPNIADTPETRSDFAKYLAEIEVLDQHVGRTLRTLDKSGQADNTIVIFTSEQGSQFPGNKWTNWNTGIHTGFIVRWPGTVETGRRTGAVVQFADVLPTLVDAAGGEVEPGDFDGTSFLPVLRGETEKHREYAYFMHNNVPEGPPYPIRAVTDGRYHYIRNLKPDAVYIEKHVMGQMKWHGYWPTWVFNTTFNKRTNMLVNRFLHRPREQFYRVDEDPYEMNNLAEDPAHAATKKHLSAELDRWMRDQGDPGAVIDSEEKWRASKRGKHFKRNITVQ